MSEGAPAAAQVQREPGLFQVLTPATGFLLGAQLLSSATAYMLLPFLAVYFHRRLGFSVAGSGFLVGLPFLAGLAFSLAGGYLTDRVGPLRSYLAATLLFGLAVGALVYAHGQGQIAATLVGLGIAWSVVNTAGQSVVNGATRPEHRGTVQNATYWVNNVGVVLGLFVSAELLGAGTSTAPFAVVFAVRVLLALAVAAVFWQTVFQRPADAGAQSRRPGVIDTFRTVARDQALLYAALSVLFLIVMESQVNSSLPLDLTSHVAGGARDLGPVLAINSVVVVLSTPFAVRLLAKLSPVRVFLAGALLTGLGLALGGIVGTLASWIAGMTLYSIGEVVWSTKLNNLLGNLPTPENSGVYFSVIGLASSLAYFLGTSVGTAVYQAFSPVVLYGGMVLVAVLAGYVFSRAVRAHGQRLALQAATGGVTADLPGVAASAQASAAAPQTPVAMAEGAASFMSPPRRAPLFGLPPLPDNLVLLEGLDPREWGILLGHTDVVSFAAGETVLRKGEEDLSMYIVVEGRMEVLIPDSQHGEQAIAEIAAGSVFGEQAFLDGAPRSASVRARTDGTMRKLTWEGFSALSAESPLLAQKLLSDLARVLSLRLRRTTEVLMLLRAV